ncbi:MAG: recombinase family protein [Chitinophagaceae bacterium]|nr:recombinase family protein [Chitinophagaceae bacterium]
MTRQRAYLYIRVSTDEQADKGYSQRNQDEQLRKYCDHHNIVVVGVYWEDYSGKTFDRPEFSLFLEHAKKHRNSADLLLFLKWDRFSRNVAESYAMIHQLRKLGIEPQAIEQPLDMSIPESKIMLAIYLAAPEVENDRRALNVIAGMRKAMKEGRHVNMAPKGYKNSRDENNNKIIVPGKDAPLIKWVFQEVAQGIHTILEVWKLARQKGLNIGKSHMWNILRNPLYCGKIYVPTYKKEPAMLVKGKHEPLISEALFNEVQDVLNGKKRKIINISYGMKEEYPLRGNLLCKQCGRVLTASSSKGNGGMYYYYHCVKGCKERFKAEDVNEKFQEELEKINRLINRNSIEYQRASLYRYLGSTNEDKPRRIAQIKIEIERAEEGLNTARKKFFEQAIDIEDLDAAKSIYQPEINRLQQELTRLIAEDSTLDEQVETFLQIVTRLPIFYDEGDLILKRQIVGLIYPEKAVVKENAIQTIRPNRAIELICRPGAGSSDPQNKTASENGGCSNVVTLSGFKPYYERGQLGYKEFVDHGSPGD